MSGTVRIVEVRAFLDLECLSDLEAAITELRDAGVPGDAEVGLVSSMGGVYVWARYAYDGAEVEIDVPAEPVEA